MEQLAKIAVAQDEAIQAVFLLSAAETLRQTAGASMAPLEEGLHAAGAVVDACDPSERRAGRRAVVVAALVKSARRSVRRRTL